MIGPRQEPQESTNPLDQFTKEDLADMVSDAQRESNEMSMMLEDLINASEMWLKFGPQDPHRDGVKCSCDASVGFRDPSCHSYSDFFNEITKLRKIK